MNKDVVVPYGTFRYRDRLLQVSGPPGSPIVELHRVMPEPPVYLGTVDVRATVPQLRSTLPREGLYNYRALGREAAEIVRAAGDEPGAMSP